VTAFVERPDFWKSHVHRARATQATPRATADGHATRDRARNDRGTRVYRWFDRPPPTFAIGVEILWRFLADRASLALPRGSEELGPCALWFCEPWRA